MKVAAGEIVVLSAQPASEWEVVEGPQPYTFEQGKCAVFLLVAGERRKVTITGPDKMKNRLILVAGGDGPKPPDPKPPVPKPEDPLKVKLKAAIDADPEPDAAKKVEHVKDLAVLYRQGVSIAQSKDIGTAAELITKAREAANLLIGPNALVGVRKVVGEEIKLILPADAPLTDDQRKAIAALFTRLATILDGL